MIYQTTMYFSNIGLLDTEEKDLLISLRLLEQTDFTQRKSYDEWWLDNYEIKASVSLPLLFKLSTLFTVEVDDKYVGVTNSRGY